MRILALAMLGAAASTMFDSATAVDPVTTTVVATNAATVVNSVVVAGSWTSTSIQVVVGISVSNPVVASIGVTMVAGGIIYRYTNSASPIHTCSPNEDCVNSDGSIACHCGKGFECKDDQCTNSTIHADPAFTTFTPAPFELLDIGLTLMDLFITTNYRGKTLHLFPLLVGFGVVILLWRKVRSRAPARIGQGNHVGSQVVENTVACPLVAAYSNRADAASAAAVLKQRDLLAHTPQLSLDRFIVGERLGKRSQVPGYYGVNSSVFKADLDGSVVVIKALYNVGVQTINLSDTFKPDYSFIEDAGKTHPNIVAGLGHFVGKASRQTLGDSWDADPEFVRKNTLFVVMEPMEQSLKELISDLLPRGPNGEVPNPRPSWPPVLPPPHTVVIIQRILRGLLHLHRHGIVHRDLKADNVLINYQPDAHSDEGVPEPMMLVKLADFGHALDTTTNPDINNFQMPYFYGMLKGGATQYLAPEVMQATPGRLNNLSYIDYSKNDVFAAGMLAHYMLFNGAEDPFATRDPEYTAVQHPHYSAANYNKPPEECPQPIADLVWAMVNPSFEERVTVEDALAQVNALVNNCDLQWTEREER